MRDYFCGWYFKCQTESDTIAVIAASHRYGGGRSNSVQIITEDASRTVFLPYDALKNEPSGFRVGHSRFTKGGISLDLRDGDFSAVGRLVFGPLTPLEYDIMGPFKYVPFMECRHSVKSMSHTVYGEIDICGKKHNFSGARGYIEGDRGHSFPSNYLWTHTFFDGGSLMLSIADIPLGVSNFRGVIGVICYRGRRWRIATYLGARIAHIRDGAATVRQGNRELTVRLIKQHSLPLAAPTHGNMSRAIHESACCVAAYTFKIGDNTVFSFETDKASFENEWHR